MFKILSCTTLCDGDIQKCVEICSIRFITVNGEFLHGGHIHMTL